MRLPDERYEEIKNTVADLFVQLDISCTPISGFEIAKKLGIIVIPYSAKKDEQKLMKTSKDGFCYETRDGVMYIFYNDDMCDERINWTILHEIAHLVLGHTEHCSLAEAEANFFAKYAIAPPVLIHRYHLSTADDIQDRFCISHEAAKNVMIYYKKWLKIPILKLYDKKLESQFGF